MIHRSLRRVAVVPVAVASLVLASCSTVPSSNATFSVNDVDYPADDFTALVEDLASGGQFQLTNGKINTTDYAPILRTLVRYEAYRQMIAELGVDETDAVRTKVTSDAQSSPNFSSFPDSVKKIVIDLGIADAVLASMTIPADNDLAQIYASGASATGVLCMSHILVATEKEARTVLDRLRAGEKFADLAREVSTEPAAKESGGSLGSGPDQPCQPLSTVQTGYDPAFTAGAVAAKVGVPSAPVKSSFGWHVILIHPFSEVAASVRQVLSENPGNILLAGWMTAADISVDPRYGTWVPSRATIE